jgi:hypothetical protein
MRGRAPALLPVAPGFYCCGLRWRAHQKVGTAPARKCCGQRGVGRRRHGSANQVILSASMHRQRRSPKPLASVGVSWRELSPGHVCRGFFHWNAGVAPLCRRKPAMKGRRLLCAASSLRSGFLAPALPSWPGLFFGGGASSARSRSRSDDSRAVPTG